MNATMSLPLVFPLTRTEVEYTMQFEAEKELSPGVARTGISQEQLKDARVTHVFVRQNDGRLKIVHEHISVADA